MNLYEGKNCPYCKTAFKETDDIVACSDCGMPHHKECWIENQGCSTFGCSGTIQGAERIINPPPTQTWAQVPNRPAEVQRRPAEIQNNPAAIQGRPIQPQFPPSQPQYRTVEIQFNSVGDRSRSTGMQSTQPQVRPAESQNRSPAAQNLPPEPQYLTVEIFNSAGDKNRYSGMQSTQPQVRQAEFQNRPPVNQNRPPELQYRAVEIKLNPAEVKNRPSDAQSAEPSDPSLSAIRAKFCPCCGTKREQDDLFCSECGHHFTSRAQE